MTGFSPSSESATDRESLFIWRYIITMITLGITIWPTLTRPTIQTSQHSWSVSLLDRLQPTLT